MHLAEYLAKLGVILLLLSFVPILLSTENTSNWEPKSYILASETVDVFFFGHTEDLYYSFYEPANVRNLTIGGYVKKVSGEPFSFRITNGKIYVSAEGVTSEKHFKFNVEPGELENGLKLDIKPSDTEVSFYVKATWQEKEDYEDAVFGGIVLGSIIGFFGLLSLIAALIVHIVTKIK